MAEQATSARSDPARRRSSEVSELREELARSREETLRLRDLLIGKDAELGALRGRLAELEAGTARLLNLGARVRSLIPSFLRPAGAGLRQRRDRRG
jgi:predicted nuclease with TOPRIM domain